MVKNTKTEKIGCMFIFTTKPALNLKTSSKAASRKHWVFFCQSVFLSKHVFLLAKIHPYIEITPTNFLMFTPTFLNI